MKSGFIMSLGTTLLVASCSGGSFQGASTTSRANGVADVKVKQKNIELPQTSLPTEDSVDDEKVNHPPIITSKAITSHQPGSLLQAPEKFDFTKWKQVNFNTDCGDKRPQWVITPELAYVVDNSEASALISDLDTVGNQVEGKFFVGSGAADDDFIGFLFGFQDVQRTYLFDWKQRSQGQQAGMCLQSLEFTRPVKECDLFLGRNGYAGDNLRVIKCANSIPWVVGKEYTYIINFRPGVIEITIKDGETVLETIKEKDKTYRNGKFGLYVNSQDKGTFRTPTIAPVRGEDYIYRVTAEDQDGDKLSYKLNQSPDGMVIDPKSGAIEWKAESKTSGSHRVEIEVTDTRGATVRQSFELNIAP